MISTLSYFKFIILFASLTTIILYFSHLSTNGGDHENAVGAMNFKIATDWNNKPIKHTTTPVEITLSWTTTGGDFLTAVFDAPFFDDPKAPDGPPGHPFPQLWDYEVVEIFFLNSKNNHYLEVEVSPHGQHLLLLLNGTRNMIEDKLPMVYSATINNNSHSWKGTAQIPLSYIPKGVDKINAYAIHGSGENRVYESLYPVPDGKYEQPDFHRLEYFQSFDLMSLAKDETKIGTYWKDS